MIFKFVKSFILGVMSILFLSSAECNSANQNGNTTITYRSVQFYIHGSGQSSNNYCSAPFAEACYNFAYYGNNPIYQNGHSWRSIVTMRIPSRNIKQDYYYGNGKNDFGQYVSGCDIWMNLPTNIDYVIDVFIQGPCEPGLNNACCGSVKSQGQIFASSYSFQRNDFPISLSPPQQTNCETCLW